MVQGMVSGPPTTKRFTLDHGGGPVHALTYNNDGKYCLTAGQDRKVKLWGTTKGNLVRTFEGCGYEILGICVSKDNAKFATCGGDRSVFWWDVTAGTIQKRFEGHSSRVNTVSLNREATVLASGGYDATLRLWDLKSQQRMPIQILSDAKDSITCSLIRDDLVVSGSVDGYVRTYDVRKGELRSDFFDQPIVSISLSEDDSILLVTTLAAPEDQTVPGTVRMMDYRNGDLLQTYKGHRSAHYRSAGSFGRNEEIVLQGDEDGRLFAWTRDTGVKVSDHKVHEKAVTWVARHPIKEEHQILTAGADGKVHVWVR